jgi:hypothetical protein
MVRVKPLAAQSGPNQPADSNADWALERALILAAEAGRFDVVAQLADELRARRLSINGVPDLFEKQPKRRF